MKKRTIWKSLLATVLSCSMVVNAFAATTEITEEKTNEDGSTSQITTTVTEGENSKKTVVVTITTSAPDANGNTTVTETEVGEETSTEVKDEIGELPEDVNVDVTVNLTPGSTATGEASGSYTESTGTKPDGDADYDYTETTHNIDREVSAEAGELDVKITESEMDMTAMAPENYEGKDYDNAEGLLKGMAPDQLQSYADAVAKPDAEGFDYQWTGYGEATNAVRAEAMDVVYAKDPVTGEPLKDADGNYIIESLTYTGKYNDGMGSTPAIFALTKYDENGNPICDENGNVQYFYGYCIDNDTEAVPGYWYSMANLEDSNYYPDAESANKLRAVVNNGYWGQADGKGSLAQLKDNLLEYYNEDSTITIKDKEGNPKTIKIYDLLKNLDESDALTATQAAIWSNANGTLATQDGKDGTIITGIYSVDKPNPGLANTDRDYNYQRDAILQATYDYLMSLKGEAAEEGSIILNDKNAVDNVSLTVGDKVGETESGDGIYNTDVKFTMSYTPSAVNDDLVVHISYIDLDGEEVTVTKRLAGSDEETRFGTIAKGEDGYYTITGLQLSENQDIDLTLKLDGSQILNEDVYIYSAYGGATQSQTMVGIASGNRDVEVTATLSVNFSVEETEELKTERKWKSKKTTVNEVEPDEEDPTDPPVDPIDPIDPVDPVDPVDPIEDIPEEDVPLVDIPDEEIPLEDIPDEEVPLAAVPQTGDASIYFAILSALSGTGLAGLALTKKREEN